jgi:hypothetical protein
MQLLHPLKGPVETGPGYVLEHAHEKTICFVSN